MSNSKIIWEVKEFSQLSASELYDILKVRTDIFVVEQKCPYQEVDGLDREAIHLWRESGGQISAYCRILPPGVKYQECSIGRVLTSPDFRRQNVGRTLRALAVCTAESKFRSRSIRISAQDYLIGFYRSFGFLPTGKKYLEDGIPHSEMLRGVK